MFRRLDFKMGSIPCAIALGGAVAIATWWEGFDAGLIALLTFFATGFGAGLPAFHEPAITAKDIEDPRRRRRLMIWIVVYAALCAGGIWRAGIGGLILWMLLLACILGHCVLVVEIVRLVRRWAQRAQ
jgi:hypothetical protein